MASTDNAPGEAASANFTVPDYSITDPADQAIADGIAGLDPYADISSSARGRGGFDVAALPGLSALSPDLRAEVERDLGAMSPARRAEAEPAAIAQVLAKHGRGIRVLLGNGAGTNRWHDENLTIAREHHDLTAEWSKITAQMTEVERYDVGADGNPVAVNRMSASAQVRAAAQLRDIDYRLGLLVKSDGSHGIEARMRLDKAMLEAVEASKSLAAQAEEHREAEKRADQLLREERINHKAELLAKHRRTSL